MFGVDPKAILMGFLQWVLAHPLLWGGAFLTCHLIGSFVGTVGKGAKSTIKAIVGLVILVGLIGWAWKKRRTLGTGVLVILVSVVVIGWLTALYESPGLRLVMLLITALVLGSLFVPGDTLWDGQPGGLLYEKCKDRPWMEVLREWGEAHGVRSNVEEELGPDAHVGRARRPKDGGPGWEVDYHRPADAEKIDVGAVGGRVNRVTDVRQVAVRPGDKIGHGTLLLSPEAPPEELTPWEQFDRMGPKHWPGPRAVPGRDPSSPESPIIAFYDVHGAPVPLDVPGVKGGNMLFVGITGSGKSAGLHVLMGDLSFRRDLGIIFLDPQGVEGGLWADRCTILASGVKECERVIAHLPRVMENRLARMKHRTWRRDDGPQCLVVVEEYAAIPKRSKEGMARWLAESRKIGCGTLLAMQRPQREFIPLEQRDNFHVRIAMSMMSEEGSQMALGAGKEVPSAVDIPFECKGAAWIHRPGGFIAARSYLLAPPGSSVATVDGEDDPIEIGALTVARATAGLKVGTVELGV